MLIPVHIVLFIDIVLIVDWLLMSGKTFLCFCIFVFCTFNFFYLIFKRKKGCFYFLYLSIVQHIAEKCRLKMKYCRYGVKLSPIIQSLSEYYIHFHRFSAGQMYGDDSWGFSHEQGDNFMRSLSCAGRKFCEVSLMCSENILWALSRVQGVNFEGSLSYAGIQFMKALFLWGRKRSPVITLLGPDNCSQTILLY